MGDHQMTLTIDLEPPFISEQTDHPGHGHARGAQSTRHLLMGEAQIQAQSLITGLAVILGKQLKKAPNSLFNATKTQKRKQILRLAVTEHNSSQEIIGKGLSLSNLAHRQTEKIRVGERDGFIGLHRAQGLTKGFVGPCQAQQQLIAMHRHGAKLHHPIHNKPQPVFVKWDNVSCREVQTISILKTGVQKAGPYFLRVKSAGDSTTAADDSLPTSVWSATSRTQTKSPHSNQ